MDYIYPSCLDGHPFFDQISSIFVSHLFKLRPQHTVTEILNIWVSSFAYKTYFIKSFFSVNPCCYKKKAARISNLSMGILCRFLSLLVCLSLVNISFLFRSLYFVYMTVMVDC